MPLHLIAHALSARATLALLGSALLLAACSPAGNSSATQQAPSGPAVAVTPAKAGVAGQSWQTEAQVQAVRQSVLAAQIPAALLQWKVKPGDAIRAGQVLAVLDARDTLAQALRAQAGVQQAMAQAQDAETQLQRQRQLRQQGFVSSAALDTLEQQAKAAKAGVEAAKAAATQAAVAQGHAQLTAPYDGFVLATHMEPGEVAAPGRPMLTVYAGDALRVTAFVPQSVSHTLDTQAAVTVTLADGSARSLEGARLIPGTDPTSQTRELRVDLPRDWKLLPGQAVQLRLGLQGHGQGQARAASAAMAAPTGVLSVPAQAVLVRGELTAVYVLQGQQFVLRPVRLGAQEGGLRQVLAGLQAGEQVALDPVKAGLAGARPAR